MCEVCALRIFRFQKSIAVPVCLAVVSGFAVASCDRTSTAAPEGMALIPAGEFLMGSDKQDPAAPRGFVMLKPLYEDEHPARRVFLPAYVIDVYEVTNAAYDRFLRATNRPAPAFWEGGRFQEGTDAEPVSQITWHDAAAFCRWAGKRLPTEAEWEKAARGPDGREFPWGNTFDPDKAHTGVAGASGPVPVGRFTQGASPYGVHDMSGNVWEWVADWYQPYPGSAAQSGYFGEKVKVIRGGGWEPGHHDSENIYRAAHRFFAPPGSGLTDGGFRCARDAR